MSATQQSERTGSSSGAPAPQRFRAATVEEALSQVRASLGEDAEIVGANRIRRGGIGGFFATELGVEVVATGHPTDVATDGATDEPTDTITTGTISTDTVRRSPLAARLAWRQAIGDARDERGAAGDGQPMMVGLEAMLAEAARSDRSERSERSIGPVAAEAPDTLDTPGTPECSPTTFAEHFLRELVQDAEELRRSPDRNRVLPGSPRALDDGTLAPCAPDPAEPSVPTPRRAAIASGGTHPIVAPDVLPGMPAPHAGGAAATSPPSRRRSPSKSSNAGRSSKGAETRPVRSARAAEHAPEPELPLDPQVAPAAPPPVTTALADLVERCMQFAATADRDSAPRKVALAITLADGGVMKLTVEMPRSR